MGISPLLAPTNPKDKLQVERLGSGESKRAHHYLCISYFFKKHHFFKESIIKAWLTNAPHSLAPFDNAK